MKVLDVGRASGYFSFEFAKKIKKSKVKNKYLNAYDLNLSEF